jgi:hypothetical protein
MGYYSARCYSSMMRLTYEPCVLLPELLQQSQQFPFQRMRCLELSLFGMGLYAPLKTDCGSAVRESVVSKGFSIPCLRSTSRNSDGLGYESITVLEFGIWIRNRYGVKSSRSYGVRRMLVL